MGHIIRAAKHPEPVPAMICRNREELTRALTEARKKRGISQNELDEIAGFQLGYTGKMEQPFPRAWPSGRTPIGPMFDLWLQSLGLALVLVDAHTAGEAIDWTTVRTVPAPRAPDMTLKRANQIRDLRREDPKRWTYSALASQFGVRVGVILDILEGKAFVSNAGMLNAA